MCAGPGRSGPDVVGRFDKPTYKEGRFIQLTDDEGVDVL